MSITLLPETALEAAGVLSEQLPETLSSTAKRIHTALVGTALEVMRERGYSPNTTEVVFFAPAESVCLSVGIHPATLYRRLPELQAHGLVACRGHFCTHNGRTRSDGSLWGVRLTPTWGSAARVGYDYLKKSYRCLGADIDAGKTAYAQMRESYPTRTKAQINISYITTWALSGQREKPVIHDSRSTRRADLERIFDVPQVRRQERPDAVYEAAVAMSQALGDNDSQRFYMAVLWGLLRLRDRGGGDYFGQLHMMICRARADRSEGFARRAGALFHARLKQADWFGSMMAAPPNRVGVRPAKA